MFNPQSGVRRCLTRVAAVASYNTKGIRNAYDVYAILEVESFDTIVQSLSVTSVRSVVKPRGKDLLDHGRSGIHGSINRDAT